MDYINPIYMFFTMFIKMLCYLTASILIEAIICIFCLVLIKRLSQLFKRFSQLFSKTQKH